jgi:hypothetical protein
MHFRRFPWLSRLYLKSGLVRPCFSPDFNCTLCAGSGPKNNQHPGARIMDGSHTSQFFLEPKLTFQRRYEALRAIFVDAETIDQVAERFGYKVSTLKSMVSRFRADCRRGAVPPFFSPTDADDHSEHAPARTGHAPNCPKSPTLES